MFSSKLNFFCLDFGRGDIFADTFLNCLEAEQQQEAQTTMYKNVSEMILT